MQYTHSCARCIPLGQWKRYDLYVCPNTTFGLTLIARFASKPSHYVSVPITIYRRWGAAASEAERALHEAWKRLLNYRNTGIFTNIERGIA